MNIYNKLFLSPSFFTIAIRKRSNRSIIDNPIFEAEYVYPSTRLHWVADPILIDYDDKTYLFYEAFHKNKGRIEVVEVYPDCTFSKPSVLLESEGHFSYPFVFNIDNQWYMIPETSDQNKVVLYKATEFPFKWDYQSVLLYEKAVDSTILKTMENTYLLTFLIHEGNERVTPKIYKINNNLTNVIDGIKELEWSEIDELNSRGAGPFFIHNDEFIRPAQANNDYEYGNNIIFYKTFVDHDIYKETYVGSLIPENVKAKKWWFNGLHTYTVSNRFEAIDIRCRKFDLLKTPRTLYNFCRKKLIKR